MPKEIEVSLDELVSSRKAISDDNGVLYKAHVGPRSWNDEERSATFVMSAETSDSYGDIVVQAGIDTKVRFEANPVALFGHRSWDMPVGEWKDVRTVRGSPRRTEGTLVFQKEGVDDVADRVARNVQSGNLKAASIGFMPRKWERILDDNGEWTYGYKFLEVELYECSVVTIPAVREALVKGVRGGADAIVTPEVIEEFMEHLKANPALAKMINRDLFEGVYREMTGNQSHSILTTSVEIDAKSLDRLDEITKRIEKAAASVEANAAASEAADDIEDATAALEELSKGLETAVLKTLDDFDPEVAKIEASERKGALTKIVDGIRNMFKSPTSANAGPDPVIPPMADPETQKALRERAEKIAAKYPAAA